MRWLPFFAFLGLCSLARAEASPRLSDRGRLLVAGSVGASWTSVPSYDGLRDAAAWRARIAPSVVYFVRDRIGIGGYASYTYGSFLASDYVVLTHTGSVGVQAALELELGARLGWLAFPSLGYARQRLVLDYREVEQLPGAAGARQQRSSLPQERGYGYVDILAASLFAPLVYHVSETFGVGFGPTLNLEVYFGPSRSVSVVAGASTWLGVSF